MISTGTVDVLTRLDVDTAAPAFSCAVAVLDAATIGEQAGIESGLRELIRLRAEHTEGTCHGPDRAHPGRRNDLLRRVADA